MLQKLVCACLCVTLLLSGYGASAKEELPHGTLTVEKTFKKDGLRFQVTLFNITNSVEESTLFKINTKVTNISKKPISYVQTACEDVRSIVAVQTSAQTYYLSSPDDQACTPTTHQKELLAGKSIHQEERFTTAFLPNNLDQDQYTLKSTLHIGKEEEVGKNVSFDTSFDDRISLPSQYMSIDATWTKASSKYQLDVKGTTKATQLKSIYLKIGKSKYSLRVNKKTQHFSLSKKITIKGIPPEAGIMEISYVDGTKYSLDVPIKMTSEK